MFADPQSVTVNAVAQTLARVGITDKEGRFAKDDGSYTLRIGQTKQSTKSGQRNRRLIRLDNRKVAADPLTADHNLEYTMGVYLVADIPAVGYTVAEAKLVIDGFLAYLTASSGAKVTQLLGGEI